MQEISLEDAIALLKMRTQVHVDKSIQFLEMMSDIFPILLRSGPLKQESVLIDGIYLIDGDLDARLVNVAASDHGVCCIVLGSLRAERFVFEGALSVRDHLQVADVLYYDGLDWGAYVGRNVDAGLIIERNGHLHVSGEIKFKTPCDFSKFSEEFTFDDDGDLSIDPAPLVAALITGRRILK